ncbi:slit homolog 2 protein-like [Saccostrea echinata]|uniref:slit homolog 2 protein-like n=1 Tax=Saccostrea echinata TaxID=191078 RepID=UPI002A80AAF0|nr:slit homolog 2 protein-like [Saccostrea echinata]
MKTNVLNLFYLSFVFCLFFSCVLSSCPAPQIDGIYKKLIFNIPLKIVTNDTFRGCDKSVNYINMDGLGIEQVSGNAFDDFYNLVYLTLANNDISLLPSSLLDYKRGIEYFRIDNNRLDRIEDGTFKHFDNVREIHLQNNSIRYMGPNAFPKNLRLLEHVNVSYNSLTYFEPWPFIPEADPGDNIDVVFDFRYNSISEFRNSLNWIYNLIQPYEYAIYLSFNNFSTLTADMVYLYNPNYTGDPFPEFLSFRMNVSQNPFFCDCKLYPFVEFLHNSLFYFYKVEDFRYRCAAPYSLVGKDFFHDVPLEDFVCDVTDDCPSGCMCQEQPNNGYLLVNCSFSKDQNGQQMNKLPDKLPNPLYGKISLHLDGHNIRLLENRNYLPKLVNLILSKNRLEDVNQDALESMNSTQHLDLSENKLKYLPKIIQRFTIDKVRINSNQFECDCDMIWMTEWINLVPIEPNYDVKCNRDDDLLLIRQITAEKLGCKVVLEIVVVIVVLGIVIAIIIGAVVTARRCPYETKVLLYRFFGVHPIPWWPDPDPHAEYDIYISHYEHDIQARQWVRTKFLQKLEENQKKKYKVFYSERDLNIGGDLFDDLVTNMKKSKRIVFLLTNEFFDDERSIFEADQAEVEHRSSDNLYGRVIYILWNKDIKKRLKSDPWKSRVEGKRVLCPDDRFFWSKMRYELPLKPLPTPHPTDFTAMFV